MNVNSNNTTNVNDINLCVKYCKRGYVNISTNNAIGVPLIESYKLFIEVDNKKTVVVKKENDEVTIERENEISFLKNEISNEDEYNQLIERLKELASDEAIAIAEYYISDDAHVVSRLIKEYDNEKATNIYSEMLHYLDDIYNYMKADESLRYFYEDDIDEVIREGKIDLVEFTEFVSNNAKACGIELVEFDDEEERNSALIRTISEVLILKKQLEQDNVRYKYKSYFYDKTRTEREAEYKKKEKAYKEKVKAETAERRETAKLMGLKALKGTMKQKKWAEDIRKNFLETVADDEDVYSFLSNTQVAQHSKFWIETRNIASAEIAEAMKTIIVATRKANEIKKGNAGYEEQVAIRQRAIDKLGIEI